VKRIPENVDFRLNWFKNVGKFGKVIGKKGDYVVEEAGEVFYRTLSEKHYKRLLKGKRVPSTGESFTSPTQAYSEKYKGVLVKYYLKKEQLVLWRK
ncbi:hypothetical protein, partial [Flammeovirga aprica]